MKRMSSSNSEAIKSMKRRSNRELNIRMKKSRIYLIINTTSINNNKTIMRITVFMKAQSHAVRATEPSSPMIRLRKHRCLRFTKLKKIIRTRLRGPQKRRYKR